MSTWVLANAKNRLAKAKTNMAMRNACMAEILKIWMGSIPDVTMYQIRVSDDVESGGTVPAHPV